MLSAAAFATRATAHATSDATPSQLVFGRDPTIGTKLTADWAKTKARKQNLIDCNNRRKNRNHREHKFKEGDKIVVKNDHQLKHSGDSYDGPCKALQVNNNGTLRIRKGVKHETVNIRNVHPHHS